MRALFLLMLVCLPLCAMRAGTGVAPLTPPPGSPSAGYFYRTQDMWGERDPLLATAVVIETKEKCLAFCGVDHLGFDSSMVTEVREQVQSLPGLEKCELFLGSSHTHAGGGGFFPHLEPILGEFDPLLREGYIAGAVEAIERAASGLQPAQLGVGYGEAPELSRLRGSVVGQPDRQVALIRIDDIAGRPIALIFNYACHPTILGPDNLLFSADFVGHARLAIEREFGGVVPIFFNGAQAEVLPIDDASEDPYRQIELFGKALGAAVNLFAQGIVTRPTVTIETLRHTYEFQVEADIPVETHASELNLLVINGHPFLTVPGELSVVYAEQLRRHAEAIGFDNLSILGLTNDAHGYILPPEAADEPLSFGGPEYGERVVSLAKKLLNNFEEHPNDSN